MEDYSDSRERQVRIPVIQQNRILKQSTEYSPQSKPTEHFSQKKVMKFQWSLNQAASTVRSTGNILLANQIQQQPQTSHFLEKSPFLIKTKRHSNPDKNGYINGSDDEKQYTIEELMNQKLINQFRDVGMVPPSPISQTIVPQKIQYLTAKQGIEQDVDPDSLYQIRTEMQNSYGKSRKVVKISTVNPSMIEQLDNQVGLFRQLQKNRRTKVQPQSIQNPEQIQLKSFQVEDASESGQIFQEFETPDFENFDSRLDSIQTAAKERTNAAAGNRVRSQQFQGSDAENKYYDIVGMKTTYTYQNDNDGSSGEEPILPKTLIEKQEQKKNLAQQHTRQKSDSSTLPAISSPIKVKPILKGPNLITREHTSNRDVSRKTNFSDHKTDFADTIDSASQNKINFVPKSSKLSQLLSKNIANISIKPTIIPNTLFNNKYSTNQESTVLGIKSAVNIQELNPSQISAKPKSLAQTNSKLSVLSEPRYESSAESLKRASAGSRNRVYVTQIQQLQDAINQTSAQVRKLPQIQSRVVKREPTPKLSNYSSQANLNNQNFVINEHAIEEANRLHKQDTISWFNKKIEKSVTDIERNKNSSVTSRKRSTPSKNQFYDFIGKQNNGPKITSQAVVKVKTDYRSKDSDNKNLKNQNSVKSLSMRSNGCQADEQLESDEEDFFESHPSIKPNKRDTGIQTSRAHFSKIQNSQKMKEYINEKAQSTDWAHSTIHDDVQFTRNKKTDGRKLFLESGNQVDEVTLKQEVAFTILSQIECEYNVAMLKRIHNDDESYNERDHELLCLGLNTLQALMFSLRLQKEWQVTVKQNYFLDLDANGYIKTYPAKNSSNSNQVITLLTRCIKLYEAKGQIVRVFKMIMEKDRLKAKLSQQKFKDQEEANGFANTVHRLGQRIYAYITMLQAEHRILKRPFILYGQDYMKEVNQEIKVFEQKYSISKDYQDK